MNKVIVSFFSLILFLVLVGCNAGESGTEDAASGSDDSNTDTTDSTENETEGESDKEEVEIRFTWWGDTARHEIYNEIADQFEEKHPHITVKREFGGWNDYWDKLTTQVAGGNAPDIVGMHQEYVSDYARRGALIDLAPYIDSGVINVDDFPQSVVDSGKLGGDTVMVAQGVTMSGQMFNTAVFDKLGVEYPDMNWTWDDFKNKAIELTEASDEEGFWGSADLSNQLTPNFKYFVRQKGKLLFTEDGQLGFDREDMIEWYEMWDELRQKGAIPDAATTSEYFEVPLEQSLIVEQKIGIGGIPANQIHLYQQQFDEGEVRMVRQPTMSGGENGEFIEGAYLSITEGSEHPEEAAMFINHFVNAEEAGKVFKLEQGSPGSTKIVELVKPLLGPAQQRTLDYLSETLPIAESAPYPPKGMSEIEQAFMDTSYSIAFGEMSIEDAVDEFIRNAESILE
ncbi:ABC transporter substrate-binding protein [Aquibacillus albus]|uniref:Multiple sugar transport system substrate-binding protein n=1 Tax=Aquibacillus albus TaxID=1168171 RepID=A0ABS2MWE9_9BACI|nr:sugar ABC transporter substrate-binding protein [Aquibacillus albus]MBM7570215.1 multiple sugar transport system substrate-binding protein [Aquibacillus albus]